MVGAGQTTNQEMDLILLYYIRITAGGSDQICETQKWMGKKKDEINFFFFADVMRRIETRLFDQPCTRVVRRGESLRILIL